MTKKSDTVDLTLHDVPLNKAMEILMLLGADAPNYVLASGCTDALSMDKGERRYYVDEEAEEDEEPEVEEEPEVKEEPEVEEDEEPEVEDDEEPEVEEDEEPEVEEDEEPEVEEDEEPEVEEDEEPEEELDDDADEYTLADIRAEVQKFLKGYKTQAAGKKAFGSLLAELPTPVKNLTAVEESEYGILMAWLKGEEDPLG